MKWNYRKLHNTNLFYWLFNLVECLELADIATNEIIKDTVNVVVKIGDGILNWSQAPNLTYIVRKTIARKNSLTHAYGLLSNNIPIDVSVQNRKNEIANTFKGDIS